MSNRGECSLASDASLFKLVWWLRAEHSRCLNTKWGIHEKYGYVVLHSKEALHLLRKESGNVNLYALENIYSYSRVRTHMCTCTHIQKQKYTNTAHSFSSFFTYPISAQGMLSQIITGGLSLSLVAAACERVETTVGHSGGSALGGS